VLHCSKQPTTVQLKTTARRVYPEEIVSRSRLDLWREHVVLAAAAAAAAAGL
jgi:hypothetical protein